MMAADIRVCTWILKHGWVVESRVMSVACVVALETRSEPVGSGRLGVEVLEADTRPYAVSYTHLTLPTIYSV